MSTATVTRRPERQRWELELDGQLAGFLEYIDTGTRLVLAHTEVLDGFEGQGAGSQLVEQVIADVRASGTPIVPTCPFVHGWLTKHPEQADVVVPELRSQFG